MDETQGKTGERSEAPYTCFIDHAKLQTTENQDANIVVLRKCSCRSVWCPICFRANRSKTISEKLREMDWRFVRHITLTIDPKKYPDPEQAYLEVREKKSIAQLVHNLTRTKGRKVERWVWLLEFHRSGHPHWHCFFEVEHEGRAGMITGEALRQYWGYGAVHEDYMRNEKHWQAFSTYFGKHGYFSKDKAHQARLPEWALSYQTPIRRFGSKRSPDTRTPEEKERNKLKIKKAKQRKHVQNCRELESMEKFAEKHGVYAEFETREQRPYEVIINSCGEMSEAVVITYGFMMGCSIHRPYQMIKLAYQDQGEYIPGVGFVIQMTDLEFFVFNENFIMAKPVEERSIQNVAS